MHCTVDFLDEDPLPDSFELEAFMLRLVCLLKGGCTPAYATPPQF